MQIIVKKKRPSRHFEHPRPLNAGATPEFERIFNQHLDTGDRHLS